MYYVPWKVESYSPGMTPDSTLGSTLGSKAMAGRLAIRESVAAYTYCADHRGPECQMALYTPDTHFMVYVDEKSATRKSFPVVRLSLPYLRT